MSAQPARYRVLEAGEAVVHELPAIKFEGEDIPVRLAVRRADDASWRGRIFFGAPDTEHERTTAEIFCAKSEQDLWQPAPQRRHHHLRALYRPLRSWPRRRTPWPNCD